jgi:hypothetical protein
MQHKTKFRLTLLASLVLASLVYHTACKREPVYIGDTDPVDPTGNNGNNNGNPAAHPCDPDSVYYAQQIQPILSSNCAVSGCHDAKSREEGVILDTYLNTRNTGKINLSNPSGSKFYQVLNKTDPKDRMPPAPRLALPADQRALLLKWIQQGAKNLSCDAACDTLNVKFSTSVMPLIDQKCKGCHSGSSPSGGIALTNYAQVKATVGNGSLVGSITHKAGYKPMPEGSAKMPFCDIRKIQIWVAKGALND